MFFLLLAQKKEKHSDWTDERLLKEIERNDTISRLLSYRGGEFETLSCIGKDRRDISNCYSMRYLA
jgi:hypothetical protein